MRLVPRLSALSALMLLVPTGVKADPFYVQTDLVSDIPGTAPVTDTNLKNPWGMSFSRTSPFWVSNQGSNTATLYSDAGGKPTKLGLTVTIPTTPAGPQGPTGQVNNGTGSFVLSDKTPAAFIFANLNGTISAWNGGLGTTAQVQVPSSSGAIFTGLALATVGGSPHLYVANTAANTIEVYNGNFQRTTLSGNFTDPNPVAGFSAYNVQNIGNNLFVTYGNNAGGVPHAGGYVDEFDLNGNFIKRIVTNGPLNDPWGVVKAPATFGVFGGDLLIGNLFDSKISAYDLSTTVPTFKGQITTNTGFASPVGLWALDFGNGVTGNSNTLFFTSGINDQKDGLFAALTPVPEPASAVHAVLALLGGSIFYAYRHWRPRNA